MKKFVKPLIFICLFAVIFALFRWTPLRDLVDFRTLLERKDQLLEIVRSNLAISALLFIGVYYLAVALSVPGAAVLSILGGFLFGPVISVILVNIGATFGALTIFLVARYLLGETFQRRYPDQLAKFNHEIEENGRSYMLTLRLIPVFPFFLINILAGLTRLPALTFLWTTAIGIIPGSIVYTYIGHTGASLDSAGIMNPRILISLILLALLSLVPVLVKKIRKRRGKR